MQHTSSTRRARPEAMAAVCLLTLAWFVATPSGQARGDGRSAAAPASGAQAARERVPRETMDAAATRTELMRVLEKHPPSVGRVLKLDPSLMQSETYLQSYPELREFLAAHPEIPQNAGYYLQGVHGVESDGWQPRNPRMDLLQAVLAGLAAFLGVAIALGVVVWVIRTVLEQRRWNRLSKIQAEVHMKLMDRFSSNDELMTYVQTPPGRRFLESGPSPLEETGRAVSAPFARILWSVQLGIVLLVTGVGLLFLSGRVVEEARQFFYIIGCLAAAVGAGFVVSAAAAYVLSRRLGLFEGSGPTRA